MISPTSAPYYQVIPLPILHLAAQNPRTTLDEETLSELAASLTVEHEPHLAQPPLVEDLGADQFRVLAGSRRVQAARRAGWQQLGCLVYPPLPPQQAHRLRLVENLHREPLHPLDQAQALRTTWLAANLTALGQAAAVDEVLADQPPGEALTALEALAHENGFLPTAPQVSWDQVLDELGLEMSRSKRKRLQRLLNLDEEVQQQVRELPLTEAGLRSLGTLEPEAQRELVAAIQEDPGLAQRTRRIARVVADGSYTLAEALQEARGQIAPLASDTAQEEAEAAAAQGEGEETPEAGMDEALVIDDVMQLLQIASDLQGVLAGLEHKLGGKPLSDLPPPWNDYAREALSLIRLALPPG